MDHHIIRAIATFIACVTLSIYPIVLAKTILHGMAPDTKGISAGFGICILGGCAFGLSLSLAIFA